MDTLLSTLQTIGIIFMVVMFFNLMIFVHELGHFWAGRWRGAYIDRFQIWFGKPIWSKKINGVEWGLGWIPAGGFVSLPQMGDMEAIEGEVKLPADLKPLKPLDKVIIAAAGPLFSLLLAFVFATCVWFAGKPGVNIPSTIGYVVPELPAASSGLQAGDHIVAIDGKEVTQWAGNMEGVTELVAMSEHEKIRFSIERKDADGKIQKMDIESGYRVPESNWWQRKALRSVGIMPASQCVVDVVQPGSPAQKAGLKQGMKIISINGEPLHSPAAFTAACAKGEEIEISVQLPHSAEGILMGIKLKAEVPSNWVGKEGARPIVGLNWSFDESMQTLEHPNPLSQVGLSLKWMGDTIAKIAAPGSDVSMQHLSGPVGIGNHLYLMLTSPDGWRMVLWFAVLLNVNLAVLNIMPLPVVDGGHVVLGLGEMITGKPVGGTLLNYIFGAFIIMLLCFFAFVTFKDIGDLVGGEKEPPPLPTPVFSAVAD